MSGAGGSYLTVLQVSCQRLPGLLGKMICGKEKAWFLLTLIWLWGHINHALCTITSVTEAEPAGASVQRSKLESDVALSIQNFDWVWSLHSA